MNLQGMILVILFLLLALCAGLWQKISDLSSLIQSLKVSLTPPEKPAHDTDDNFADDRQRPIRKRANDNPDPSRAYCEMRYCGIFPAVDEASLKQPQDY